MTFVTIDNENDDMSAAGYVTEGDCSRGVALVCNSAAAEAIGKLSHDYKLHSCTFYQFELSISKKT